MSEVEDTKNAPPSAEEEEPVTLDRALEIASALLQKKQFEPGVEIYQRVLAVLPDHVDSHHFLGVALHHLGKSDEGIEHIRKAIELDPSYADAHNNLGNVLRQLGRLDEALDAYEKALELRPDNVDSLNNVGTILRAKGMLKEAVELYRRALQLAPDHADAHQNLGNAYLALDQHEEALEEYRRALMIRPFHGSSYFRLGAALYTVGRVESAAEVYRKWLELDPGNPEATHLVAACTGKDVPARASNEFVKRTFDGFANSFDEVLQRLDYKAPELVRDAIEKEVGAPAAALDILDAGCGTGLGGTLFRPFAKRLAGVDLSEQMLLRARSRNVYHSLSLGDLTEYLEKHPAEFDLVASVDTLVYFGDLAPVFSGLAIALRPGGRAFFTVEKAADAPNGFILCPHGRYGHTEKYVRETLSGAGLVARSIEDVVPRSEVGKPVAGLLVIAQRPA